MLWVAVHCHQLELDVALRAQDDPSPVAVCSTLLVHQANEAAQALGIHSGLRRATALSIAPQLRLIEHRSTVQQEALEQVAGWLLQFTPAVSLQAPDSVVLDIHASLRLFGGQARLIERVRAGLRELGFSTHLGIAPTATAAWLLARWRDGLCIEHESMLAGGLADLPIHLLAAAGTHQEALAAIGVHRFADLARLPRAGLARRHGTALLFEIDTALGRQAEPRRWFQAPERFAVRLELLAQVERSEALLFAAQRLLLQLCGWLAARRAATRSVLLTAEHESGRHACAPTCIELRLSQPSREPQRLITLLREQLVRLVLPAPVHTLHLECDQVVTLPGQHGELFPTHASEAEGLARLIERLQSRLGRDQVQRLLLVADHRPEAAYRVDPIDHPDRPRPKSGGDTAQPSIPLPGMPRPLWLLHEPLQLAERQHRPWWRGPLTLLSGPERIETGWWDAHLVQRDYFIAEGDSGCVWIYRARTVQGTESGWFLQGVFG